MNSRKLVVSVSLGVSMIGVIGWLALPGPGDGGLTQGETCSAASSSGPAPESTGADAADAEQKNGAADVATSKAPETGPDDVPPEIVDDGPISIEGTVTDADGEPVLEAKIIVLHRGAWERRFRRRLDRMKDDPFRAIRGPQSTLDKLPCHYPRRRPTRRDITPCGARRGRVSRLRAPRGLCREPRR